MFTNRPALRSELQPKTKGKPAKLSELEKDFFLIRDSVQKALLSNSNNGSAAAPVKLHNMLEDCFNHVRDEEILLYNHDTREQLLEWVVADIVGYGPIEPLLKIKISQKSWSMDRTRSLWSGLV